MRHIQSCPTKNVMRNMRNMPLAKRNWLRFGKYEWVLQNEKKLFEAHIDLLYVIVQFCTVYVAMCGSILHCIVLYNILCGIEQYFVASAQLLSVNSLSSRYVTDWPLTMLSNVIQSLTMGGLVTSSCVIKLLWSDHMTTCTQFTESYLEPV